MSTSERVTQQRAIHTHPTNGLNAAAYLVASDVKASSIRPLLEQVTRMFIMQILDGVLMMFVGWDTYLNLAAAISGESSRENAS